MEFGPLEIGTLLALSGGALGLLSRERDKARAHALDTWDRRLRGQEIAAQAHVGALAAVHQPAYPALHTAHFAAPLAAPSVTTVDAPQLPAAPVPTFGEMQTQGLVQPGDRLVVGYRADGTPRWGSWLELYNLLMLGLSGYGKSTAARYLACWHVLNGGRLVIIDPHGQSGDESLLQTLRPLEAAFLCDPATDAAGAVRALRLADAEMRGRLNGERTATWPLMVVIDELKEAMTYSAWKEAAGPIADYLSVGNTAGRKKRCYALATSQLATVDQVGGGAVQQSFVALAAFRSKRRQAQVLDFEREEKRTIQRLPVGSAMFMGAHDTEPEVLHFPQTTPADAAALAATWLPDGYFTTLVDAPPVAAEKPKVAVEAARAAELFLSGRSMAEIVEELRGVKSSQGARYQAALAEVQQLVREALRREG